MKAHIVKAIFFEAARRVRRTPDAPPQITGHSYKAELMAGGEVDPALGWVVDYGDMKALFEPVRRQLDHRCLDDITALGGDTSPENIARWIGEQLRPWPAWFEGVRVSVLGEGAFAPVLLPANPFEGLPERFGFSFAAAQSLPQLPPSHPCHHLHGHTYQAEVAGENPAMLEPLLAPLHAALHDRHINTVPGLEQATCERICRWMWLFLEGQGARPSLVVVQETPNNRCLYLGE